MKTKSNFTDGKNLDMSVVGDYHKYPDGTVFEVKNGKLVPGTGGGGFKIYDSDIDGEQIFIKKGLSHLDLIGAAIHNHVDGWDLYMMITGCTPIPDDPDSKIFLIISSADSDRLSTILYIPATGELLPRA